MTLNDVIALIAATREDALAQAAARSRTAEGFDPATALHLARAALCDHLMAAVQSGRLPSP